jgi:hypothetical protein
MPGGYGVILKTTPYPFAPPKAVVPFEMWENRKIQGLARQCLADNERVRHPGLG